MSGYVYQNAQRGTWEAYLHTDLGDGKGRRQVHRGGFATSDEAWEAIADIQENPSFAKYELEPLPPVLPEEDLLATFGVCANHDEPEMWLDIGVSNQATRKEAERLCKEECPVFDECRKVVDHIEKYGRQRKALMNAVMAGEGPTRRFERRKEECRQLTAA